MIKRILLLSATACAALLLCEPTSAQPPAAGPKPRGGQAANAPTAPPGPTPRALDGKPDFSGYWRGMRENGKPGGNMGKDEPNFILPFTAEGKRALLYAQNHTADPEALCYPGGIPRHDASGLAFQILQAPARIAIFYHYNTHRLISIGDGLKPDNGPEPLYFGHAAAHWEGETLVIETRGLKDSAKDHIWLDENGDPTSDQTTVVERWTRPDAGRLHLVLTITDPKYYTRPIVFTRDWQPVAAGQEMPEYICAEDNVDADHIGPGAGPIGPNGDRGFSLQAPLPKTPPGPEAYGQ